MPEREQSEDAETAENTGLTKETGLSEDAEMAEDMLAEAQGPAGAEDRPDGLNPLERRILSLERRNFKHQGTKEKAIKALGLTPIAYYQRLNVMLDDPRVHAAAPRLAAALRARRDAD